MLADLLAPALPARIAPATTASTRTNPTVPVVRRENFFTCSLLGDGCSTLARFLSAPKSCRAPRGHIVRWATRESTGSQRPAYYRTVRDIGVGMLGYAFMGKAHSNAFRKVAYMPEEAPLAPRLVAIAVRNEDAVAAAARRYGYERWTTDWHDIVTDDRIGLFDNGGPNSLHAEPTVAAAQAGKHVVCEKPLGRHASESYEIWQAVAATGVRHMCAFNYRFVPAV